MTNDEYAAYMDTHVANMEPEKREALINAIKMVFRTFVEDETQGILILVDKEHYMTTMGLNASYYESARLVQLAMHTFIEAEQDADRETKH